MRSLRTLEGCWTEPVIPQVLDAAAERRWIQVVSFAFTAVSVERADSTFSGPSCIVTDHEDGYRGSWWLPSWGWYFALDLFCDSWRVVHNIQPTWHHMLVKQQVKGKRR